MLSKKLKHTFALTLNSEPMTPTNHSQNPGRDAIRKELKELSPEINLPEPHPPEPPEGYFEELPRVLMHRLMAEQKALGNPVRAFNAKGWDSGEYLLRRYGDEPKSKTLYRILQTRYWRIAAVAAILLLVVAVGFLDFRGSDNPAADIALEINEPEIEAYLSMNLDEIETSQLMELAPLTPIELTSGEAGSMLEIYLQDFDAESLYEAL
jgi:hypothetical protein